MALSNLAWVLASNDKQVLQIDWDLEAPGLHRYLRPFLVDPELRTTLGLIDFVWDIAKDKLTPRKAGSELTQFASLDDYVVGLDWKPAASVLSLLYRPECKTTTTLSG